MDDAQIARAGFAFQKDSEFMAIFNHYILKGLETVLIKRLEHILYNAFYIQENYEMVEPQPLGFNNVMFCFICLAIGICLSIIKVIMELITSKIYTKKVGAKTNQRGGVTASSRSPMRSTVRDAR